jgi:transposase
MEVEMSAERLCMRQVREILRLRSQGRSGREIATSLGIGRTTVHDYLARATVAGLTWPLPEGLGDDEIEKLLFVPHEDQRPSRPLPDWQWVHKELKRKHVTLLLLWQEYKTQEPEGYQYSQFCDLYRQWAKTLHVWMRQEHLGGDKLFVDFSGDGIPWIDQVTGEVHEAHLFVGVLGASNYTFAYTVPTEKLPDWIECHVKAMAFLGGVPKVVVPDQPKTAVQKSCRYDPEVNPAYMDFARHYSTVVIDSAQLN